MWKPLGARPVSPTTMNVRRSWNNGLTRWVLKRAGAYLSELCIRSPSPKFCYHTRKLPDLVCRTNSLSLHNTSKEAHWSAHSGEQLAVLKILKTGVSEWGAIGVPS